MAKNLAGVFANHPQVGSNTNMNANVAAVVTITAADSESLAIIKGIFWSYNGTPTAGKITVQDGATTVFEVDVTAAGPGFLPTDELATTRGNNAVITLAAAGDGVTGKVNVIYE